MLLAVLYHPIPPLRRLALLAQSAQAFLKGEELPPFDGQKEGGAGGVGGVDVGDGAAGGEAGGEDQRHSSDGLGGEGKRGSGSSSPGRSGKVGSGKGAGSGGGGGGGGRSGDYRGYGGGGSGGGLEVDTEVPALPHQNNGRDLSTFPLPHPRLALTAPLSPPLAPQIIIHYSP